MYSDRKANEKAIADKELTVPDLNVQFERAKSNVEAAEADKSKAAAAHSDARAHLEADSTLKAYGIDTVLIGSYKRHVAIRRVKDVDVLSKLPQLPRDVAPRQLLECFAAVLARAYGTGRVEVQRRSVKVDFPVLGLAVDAVPTRPCMSSPYIEIPDRSGGWETTNPERLTELTTAMNNRYDGEYVPLVKLVRQARRHNLGDGQRPGGFYCEILTYHAAQAGLDTRSTATLFTSALRSIAVQLQSAAAGAAVLDPTMPGAVISINATDAQRQTAAATFAALASKAETALQMALCPSARAFREIFGRNDDGDWVFEMPAACNEDGTAKPLHRVSSGERTIPAGDGRFA
ncbi:MAG: nucleotidyltransferase [Acidimicrobiaceae bacterium]|nr:nucleotidyltransferase [Acidimicrobiaceae bacterium]